VKRISLIIGLAWVLLLPKGPTLQEEKDPTPLEQGRAVSLRILQRKLRDCMEKGNCPNDLLTICDLTKILGYVLDDKNQDLILFGQVDPKAPPLYTEDFVVALRNAWLKYAFSQGYTSYYSDPGCSIDPDPKVMQRLNEIGKQILRSSSPDAVEEGIKKWHIVGKSPQQVRVLSIPFNTHFAKVMVDADYYMKKLVNGSVDLGIDGFVSLTDITIERVKEDIRLNRPISIPFSTMHRFWFYPGENKYGEDEGIVIIRKCPVILLTEEEYLTQSGSISGTGQADPLAKEFTESFSRLYSEIAKRKPRYLELEGLFRFVALTKIMKFKDVRLTLDYFLGQFPVPEVKVDSTLPGITHVKNFQHRRDFPDHIEIAQFWLPSCGGVGIHIKISQANFVKDRQEKLCDLRKTILNARPSPQKLFWDFLTE